MKQQIDVTNTIAIATPEVVEEEPMVTSSLHEACKEGALNVIKKILEDDETVDVNEADDDDWTPLHHAVHGGSLEVISFLVEEAGADFDAITTTSEGQEALHFSCSDGHLDVIKYIAENGGQHMMNAENESQLTPLHFASLEGHFDMVRYLLEEHNVDPEAMDEDRWTALHYACLAGDLEIVRYLAEEHDVDCDTAEVDGWTPLHCAANKGCTDIVQYLLEKHDVSEEAVVDEVCQNALHLAASEGRLETVKYLVEYGFDVNEESSDLSTAFHLAARYGQLDVVTYFVERLDAGSRFELLFSENASDKTAYDIAVEKAESEDEDYANQELVDYLHSFVARVTVPGALANDDVCVKLNPELDEDELELANQSLKIIEESDVREVSYHILGYLCLSDVRQ